MFAYVCTLSEHEQAEIRKKLVNAGVSGEDLELAMNSRICDIEEVYDEA